MPGRTKRHGPGIVGDLWIKVQVRGARADELQVGQPLGALGHEPLVELAPQRPVHPVVFVAELGPAVALGSRVARESWRHVRALQLQRIAGDNPDERRGRCRQCGKADDVVLDDHIGGGPPHDVGEVVMAIPRARDQFLPDRPDPGVELLERRLAEFRGRPGDEVLPELPRILLSAGFAGQASTAGVAGQASTARFGEVDQVLGESERLELALPGCLGGEDDPVPAAAEHVADPDAVVGGPVGALRHEQDGQGPHVAAPGETENQEVRHSREASEHTGKTVRCRPSGTFVPRLRRRPE